jgi:hypothetical protein
MTRIENWKERVESWSVWQPMLLHIWDILDDVGDPLHHRRVMAFESRGIPTMDD